MSPPTQDRPRGRPKAENAPVTVDEILSAALRAFATHGYDGVSVRTLNRELGVSHNLLNQRFGSKQGLWYAAVDSGFGNLVRDVETAYDPTLTDPLDQLGRVIRRFLEHSAFHPELLGLMNIEARQDTERLSYIYDTYIDPATTKIGRLLEYLAAEGRIRPISRRSFHFLIAHGAAAPFSLLPLARLFDPLDPLDPREITVHANLIAELVISGLEERGERD
ncbi:MAG TPA: TetR/AcrR family transcriptional regulator [Solirubrobacteraceae bacterium]|nr:TetR/AcrR family transcriptional regulator [Solirubrobacteraceae bacterium]